ncbi:MAG: hypothetical protein Kow00121_02390 [Elainellaceae cyanobacterium]
MNRGQYRLLRVSLILLPYLSYVGLVGLIAVTFSLLAKYRRTALDSLTHDGLLLLTGLLLISSLFAYNRAEAFLQLANFLPFFLFFAVVPLLLRQTDRLKQIATDLVIATLPINAIALIEYILRADFIPRSLRRVPFIDWVRDRPHAGRATVMFNHPNALASYLVLILGLGLGLILYHSLQKRLGSAPRLTAGLGNLVWLSLATYANLIGIFCSGSRNGLLVAVIQLGLFVLGWGLLTRINRSALLITFISLFGFLAGAAWFGIGGRSLAPTTWANDARLRLWHVAISLIQDQPWFGWGLGNYKFLFPARLLVLYPSCEAVRNQPVVPVECANVTHPHNFWLLLASETGILLAIVFTVWVGFLYGRSVKLLIAKQLKPLESALLLGYTLAFLGCTAFAFFDVTLYDARVNALNWTVLASIYSLSTQELP